MCGLRALCKRMPGRGNSWGPSPEYGQGKVHFLYALRPGVPPAGKELQQAAGFYGRAEIEKALRRQKREPAVFVARGGLFSPALWVYLCAAGAGITAKRRNFSCFYLWEFILAQNYRIPDSRSRHFPVIFEKAINIEVSPIPVIVLRMASLDSLQLHTEFFHQPNCFYAVNGFSKYLVCIQYMKGIINYCHFPEFDFAAL